MVHSVGKDPVVVGVVVRRITAELVSTLQHLLQDMDTVNLLLSHPPFLKIPGQSLD